MTEQQQLSLQIGDEKKEEQLLKHLLKDRQVVFSENCKLPLGKPIVLVGFPSAGKSSIGKTLALALSCPFIDSDRLIEQAFEGLSCRELYLKYGEEYFRYYEKQAIASIDMESFFVLATGGGGLKEKENRERLKKGVVIYLKTSATVLLSRLLSRKPLPGYLSEGDPTECFYQMFDERSKLYEEMADFSLVMDDLTIAQAAKIIAKQALHGF